MQVVVTNSSGVSAATTVQLQSVLPGFFRLTEDYVTATDSLGGYVAPANLVSGLLTMPAKPGDTIVLWGTGFGPTNPGLTAGEVVTNAAPLLNPVKIRIGQATAELNYVGVTGVGVYQFNVQCGGARLTERRLSGAGRGGGRADQHDSAAANPALMLRPAEQ